MGEIYISYFDECQKKNLCTQQLSSKTYVALEIPVVE